MNYFVVSVVQSNDYQTDGNIVFVESSFSLAQIQADFLVSMGESVVVTEANGKGVVNKWVFRKGKPSEMMEVY